MNLSFEKLWCGIAATLKPRPTWNDAFLDALAGRARHAALSGRLSDAELACLYALKRNPAQGRALEVRGLVAARRGDWAQAAGHFEHAIGSGHRTAEVHRALAEARLRTGDLAGAEESVRAAMLLSPEDPDAVAESAAIALARGNVAAAIQLALRVLAMRPSHSRALLVHGGALLRRGDLPAAATAYRNAAEAVAGAEAWSGLGDVHRAAGRLDEARDCYDRALALEPRSADLHVALGDVYLEARHFGEARAYYDAALRIAPDLAPAMSRLARVAAEAGETDVAERLLLRVRDLAPGDVESLLSLGLLRQAEGRMDEALDCYRRATAIDPIAPAAHYHAGLVHLSRGEFAAGWEECEWRLRLPAFQRLRSLARPLWRGEDPAGHALLVQHDAGASDTIQFLRYVPLLAGRGARVFAEMAPELERLVRRMPGVEGVVTGVDDVARLAPSVAWRCPLLSLPHRFGTTPATIPADVPYLEPDPARVAAFRARLEQRGAARNIGLAWEDGVVNPRTAFSVDSLGRLLHALSRESGHTWVALQRQGGSAAIASLVDWTGELRSLSDAAELVAALDLVIGPATPLTHLAAALGKPVWFLLPHVADWRWGTASTTPWYPTARLYRQNAAGDWSDVVRAVSDSMAAR